MGEKSCIINQIPFGSNKLAVVSSKEVLTYQELNNRVLDFIKGLSSLLSKKKNYKTIGVCMDKSVEAICAVLAIINIEAIYVPLDPADPPERLKYILKNSECDVVISDKPGFRLGELKGIESFSYAEVINTADLVSDSPVKFKVAKNEGIFQVIYTSGSTGTPKGIKITSAGIVNRINWMKEAFPLRRNSRVLQKTPLTFDVSVGEVLWPLVSGAALVVPEHDVHKNLFSIVEYVRRYSVTHIHFVPTMLNEFSEYVSNLGEVDSFSSLKVIACSGERLQKSTALRAKQLFKAQVFNIYGPSETGEVSFYEFKSEESISTFSSVPIGKPINNTEFYVLNHNMESVSEGELYISGLSVSEGYINDKKKTDKFFLKNRRKKNRAAFTKMYKTGDYVRQGADGNIEFLDRVDSQIKFNGIRIEPAEIERVAKLYPGVSNVVVAVRNSLQLFLYYTVMGDDNFTEVSLKKHVAGYIPQYMMPSVFVRLNRLPITKNGKLDFNKLDALSVVTKRAKKKEALSSEEEELFSIWRDIFKSENFSIHDSFFSLGGNSILAIKTCSLIYKKFGVWITIKDVYKYLTIKKLSKLISRLKFENKKVEFFKYVENSSETKKFPMTEVQQAYYLGRKSIYNLGGISTIDYREFAFKDIDHKRLEVSLNKLIKLTPALRLEFYDTIEQKILDRVPFYKIKQINLSKLAKKAKEICLKSIRLEMITSKNERWPYFEFVLVNMGDCCVLHFYIDALIFDAHSFYLFFKKWGELYSGKLVREDNFSFRDYVLAKERFKSDSLYKKSKRYWQDRINSFSLGPQLPLKNPVEKVNNLSFKRLEFCVPEEIWEVLRARCQLYNLTPAIVILGVYSKLLKSWSSTTKFSINITQFIRHPFFSDVDDLIGEFTSLLCFEVDFSSEKRTFLDWITELQACYLRDNENAFYDGISFQRDLAKHYDRREGALLPVVFTCTLNLDDQGINRSFSESPFETIFEATKTSQVWLDCQVFKLEESDQICIAWDYVNELFDSKLMNLMFDEFKQLTALLTKKNWDFLLSEFRSFNNDIGLSGQNNATVALKKLLHEDVFESAVKFHNKPAIIFSDLDFVDYNNFFRLIKLVKHKLFDAGVRQKAGVAIMLPRSAEQIATVIAVLDMGGAYIPVNYDEPLCRCENVLKKSKAGFICTDPKKAQSFQLMLKDNAVKPIFVNRGEARIDFSEVDCSSTAGLESMAYIIFTSGSTGEPKGVVISHQAALNTILDINNRFSVNSKDRILSLSALSFDLSVYDIFGALSVGAALVLPAEHEAKNPEAWFQLIVNHKVTIWNSVPAYMQMFLDYVEGNEKVISTIVSLRLVFLSGDWIPLDMPKRIKKIFPNCRVISLGGATEAAIWSVIYDASNFVRGKNKYSIPYGLAMSNQKIYVLNDAFEQCRPMVVGKIFLAGLGLSEGYINDEALTKKRFLLHPKTKERIYDTGDLGRVMLSGDVEFLGREDFQIKLNGCRIELGEIEKHIDSFPGIKKSVVLLRDKKLHAVLKPRNTQNNRWPKRGTLSGNIEGCFNNEPASSRLMRAFFLDIDSLCAAKMLNTLIALSGKKAGCKDIDPEDMKYSSNYNYLINDWVLFLSKKGFIRKNERKKSYAPSNKKLKSAQEISREYCSLQKKYPDFLDILEYVKRNLKAHVSFLLEKSDPRDVLFSSANEGLSKGFFENSFDCYYLEAMSNFVSTCIGKSQDSQIIDVLELGSGVGSFLDKFKTNLTENVKYVYTDISPYFLALAKRKFSKLKNVDYKKLDFNIDPYFQGFSDKKFDVVISFNAIHNAKSLKTSLEYIKSILKPGGKLFLLEGTEVNAFFLSTAAFMMKGFQPDLSERSALLLSKSEWKNVLVAAGFGAPQFFSKNNLKYGDFGYEIIFVQSSGFEVNESRLVSYLSARLPQYMIPKYYTVLTDFPLNESGKIDRKRLATLNLGSLSKKPSKIYSVEGEVIRGDKIMAKLHKIFKEVLSINELGLDDDFFEYGGDSLSVIRLLSIINQKLNKRFTVNELNHYRSVKRLREFGWPVSKEGSYESK